MGGGTENIKFKTFTKPFVLYLLATELNTKTIERNAIYWKCGNYRNRRLHYTLLQKMHACFYSPSPLQRYINFRMATISIIKREKGKKEKRIRIMRLADEKKKEKKGKNWNLVRLIENYPILF